MSIQRIELREHVPATALLTDRDARRLSGAFSQQIGLRPTGRPGEYVLSPSHYVGTIRLPDSSIVVKPKVPVSNLFWMLSYAHELADFRGLDVGLAETEDIFEFIVKIFAEKVLDLARQGLTRGYVEREENLSTVRGRVLVLENLRKNSAIKSRVFCRLVEHTEDVKENQILKLCCFLLLREPLRDWQTMMGLRSALGRFEHVRLVPLTDADIDSVFFNRLNERYAGCIALARLLLSRMSLRETLGPVPASSFLIDMNRLFERFVAAVLQQQVERLGGRLATQTGIRLTMAEEGMKPIYGVPDLFLRRPDGATVVLDTKYKDPGHEGWVIGDVYQVSAHCAAAGSSLGVLIYASIGDWRWRRQLVGSETIVMGLSLPLRRPRDQIIPRIADLASAAIGSEGTSDND